jgi:hypothetical protein
MLTEKKNKSEYLQPAIALLLSVTLVIINVLRIIRVPITIDETGYDPNETYAELWQSTRSHANNHMLHSLIRKFLVEHFSGNVFILRVDSLAALIVFLLFTWLICRALFKNSWWALLSFCVLNLVSPLLFQFWGLSRGYALSLALMMMSIYYLLVYFRNAKYGMLWLAYLTAFLSAYSNFGYLNYFVSLAIVVAFHNFILKDTGRKKRWLNDIGITLIATSALAVIITFPLKRVWEFGELVFMGKNGFVEDTIKSLVGSGLFMRNQNLINIFTWAVIGITVLQGIYWTFIFFKNQFSTDAEKNAFKTGLVFYLLLTVPVAAMVAQHMLLHINYLTDRTALFYIILFTLNLVYWLCYLKQSVSKIAWISLIVLSGATAWNFYSNLNFTSTMLWWYDADDLTVIARIGKESKILNRKIKVGTTWCFIPAFNYNFDNKYPGKFYHIPDPVGVPGTDTTVDFYYVASGEVSDKITTRYEVDTSFMYGGFILYRKKGLLQPGSH